MSSTRIPSLVLDRFGARQFDVSNKKVSCHIHMDPAQFMAYVQRFYSQAIEQNEGKSILVDGYAPFCKHIFVPNFIRAKAGYARIEDENRSLLKSDYVARTDYELPVLTRWFPADKVEAPEATHLDLILYSREQINKENLETGVGLEMKTMGGIQVPEDADYGIISIKPQIGVEEIPMTPITAMRNALPIAEGGSGTPLSREDYLKAVEFWKHHAMISSH